MITEKGYTLHSTQGSHFSTQLPFSKFYTCKKELFWIYACKEKAHESVSEGTYQCKKTAPTQLALSDEQLRMSAFQILTQYLEERKEDKLTTNTAHN